MSYSFAARGKTKTEAILDAEAKFAAVVVSQPVHAADQEVALANLRAHVALVVDPGYEEEISISMNGSVMTSTGAEGPVVHSASSGCSVYVSRATKPV